MNDRKVESLLDTSMKNLREIVDSNTIIGEKIVAGDGVTIIPISKVSFGFASGGSDFPTKTNKDLFGGGSGGGVSIQPVALIVCVGGDVKVLEIPTSANTGDKIVNLVPDLVGKVTSLIGKKKDPKEEDAE